jgi:sulfur carrier protein
VTVNGEYREVADRINVADLVVELKGRAPSSTETYNKVPLHTRGLAVAVNGDVVPRSAWERTAIGDGDAIEVLTAVQGG